LVARSIRFKGALLDGAHIRRPSRSSRTQEKIANAFRNAVYAEDQDESYFGIPSAKFSKLFDRDSNDLMWAPDGDEAFDDGSYVLQFDVKDRVRLIAFKSSEGFVHDPATLSDVWLPADEFYRVLQQWQKAFDSEWAAMQKI